MRAHITAVALTFAALGLGFAVLGLAAAPARAQSGYDRPGGDYASGPVLSGDPQSCARRCERDGNCRSWSFAYPSAGGPAMCWLKREVTPRVKANCCVSGVRGGAVIEPLGEFEFSIDRIGGDYRTFDTVPDPRGWPCASACQGDNRCRAWTYRRLGYGTAAARCYLKDAIKPPTPRPCCISGVVR